VKLPGVPFGRREKDEAGETRRQIVGSYITSTSGNKMYFGKILQTLPVSTTALLILRKFWTVRTGEISCNLYEDQPVGNFWEMGSSNSL